MTLNIALPLLVALGIRILINLLNPDHVSNTSDHILLGIWQGVLLYYALTTLPDLAIVVGFVVTAKFLFDFTRGYEDIASRCIMSVVGIGIGLLVTNVLSQFLEESGILGDVNPKPRERERSTSNNLPTNPISPSRELHAHEPSSRRLRLVSFGRSNPDRHRSSRHTREHSPPPRHRDRDRHTDHEHDLSIRDVVSPAPTHALSVDTQPSISIDSCPSSIDPQGVMSPAERQVAILRARASLADSERRRFKEERKWALSQGNKARANQLAWQVKRFSALMESYHREADAKVVEAARAEAPGPSVAFPGRSSRTRPSTSAAAGPSSSSRRAVSQPVASSSYHPRQSTSQRQYTTGSSPLVSVTVGTPATPASGSRTRKRSGGSGSGLKPAIHAQSSAAREFLSRR